MQDPIISTDLSTAPIVEDIPISGGVSPVDIPTLYKPGFDTSTQKATLATLMNSMKVPAQEELYIDPVLTPQPVTKRYKTYSPFIDNEELAAERQPWYNKWSNAILKMGATAIGTFAEGLMTIPDTVSAIRSGKISDLYQSDFESDIDRWLKNLEDEFPNYYSKWEKEHPFLSALPFSGGSANFWSDKVLKNLGFTVGAIGSAMAQDYLVGVLTAGVGEIPLLSAQLGKASLWLNKIFTGTDRVADVLKPAIEVGKTSKQLFNIERLAQLSAAAKVGTSTRYALNMYGAARTEAAIEARDGYEQIKSDLIQEFVDVNGYDPHGTDLQRIEAFATAGANVRMGINMAILTLSNAIQFDNILKPYSSGRKQFQSSLTTTLEQQRTRIGLKEGSKDIFEQISTATGKGKVWNIIRPQIPNILSEGIIEEGGQFAAQAGTTHYYEELYKGNHRGTIDDVIQSTFYGLGQEFGSTEGLENILLGSITGAIFGGIGALKDRGVRSQQTQTILNLLNSQGLTGLLHDTYGSAAKAAQIKEDMQKAVAENNIFRYKNLQHDLFTDFIISGAKAGRHDVRLEQLKMLKELTPAEFQKAFGVDMADNQLPVGQYVDMLINKANDIKKSYDAIDKTFTNPYTFYKKPKTEEEVDESLRHNVFEEWKKSLVYYTSNISDVNTRLASIGTDIGRINPVISSREVENLTDANYYKDLKNQYRSEIKALEAENANEYTSKEVRKANREKINTLNRKIDLIEKFLSSDTVDETNTNFMNVFDDVLHYDINNQSDERAIEVKKEQLVDLINYGTDIRKLKARKEQSSKAYDILTTEKGFNQYFDSLYKKRTTPLPVTPEAVPLPSEAVQPEGTSQFSIPLQGGGSRLFKVGTQYEKTGKSGLPKTLIILGTEDSKIVVETNTGARKEVTPEHLSANYKRSKTEAEKIAEQLAELQRKQAEFEQSQKEAQIQSGTTSTNENTTDLKFQSPEPKKKPTDILFFSTAESSEEWDKNPTPMTQRRRAFLNNAKNASNRSTMRMLLATKNQEASLNLSGLTDLLLQNAPQSVKDAPIDPDNGVVFAVYIDRTSSGDYYIDTKGKHIGKVGDPIDINQLVVSVMPSTSLTWSDNSPRFREGEEAQAREYQKVWRDKRTQLLGLPGSQYEAYEFGISRGLPLINPVNSSGELEHNPIIPTLIPKSKIALEGLIVISDNGIINHQGQNLNFPVGRPVLQYEDTLQFLNNRVLTNREQQVIYDLLVELAERAKETGKLDQSIISYLQGVIYWGAPNTQNGPKSAGRNQLYVDKTFNLVSGDGTLNIPFTPDSLKSNSSVIRLYLQGIYNNVNKYKLEKLANQPFTEIVAINPNKTFSTITWKSYQHFLISPTYDLVQADKSPLKGTKRDESDLPLYTSVRGINPNVENDYNFSQKYAVIQGIELPRTQAQPSQPAAKPASSTPPTNLSSDIFTTSGGENILYNYTIEDGKMKVVSVTQDDSYRTWEARYSAARPNETPQEILATLAAAIEKSVGSKPVPQPPIPVQRISGEVEAKSPVPQQPNKPIEVEAPKPLTPVKQRTSEEIEKARASEIAAINVPPIEKTEVKKRKLTKEEQLAAVRKLLLGIGNKFKLNGVEYTVADHQGYAVQFINPQGNNSSEYPFVVKKSLDSDEVASNFTYILFQNNLAEIEEKQTVSVENTEEIERRKAEINNKYDAELAALSTSTVPTVPAQPTETNIDPPQINLGLPPLDNPEYRKVQNFAVARMTEADRKAFEKWRAENVPNIPVEILSNLVEVNPEEFAWGVFEDGVAKFYESAERGTEYHEIFEGIWKGFLPAGEQQQILGEFRQRKGSFKDRETGKQVTYTNATDRQAKEKIADEFADFRLGKLPAKSLSSFLVRFFRAIINFFRSFGRKPSLKTRLFEKINTGGYRESVLPDTIYDGVAEYSRVAPYSESQTHDLVQDITARIFQLLFKDNKSLFDLEKITDSQLFSQVRDEYIARGSVIQDEQWDQLVNKTKDFLRTFKIEFDEDSNVTINDEQSDRNEYTPKAFTVDAKKSSPYPVKLVVGTLIKTAPTSQTTNVLELPKPKPSGIGGYELANFSKIFVNLLDKLANSSSVDELMDRLVKAAEENPDYVRIFTRLRGNRRDKKIPYSQLSSHDWRLLINFFSVFNKQKPEALIQYIKEGGAGIFTNPANIQNIAAKVRDTWIDNMKALSEDPKSLIKYDRATKTYKIDSEAIRNLPIRTPEDMVTMLETVGVPISLEVYDQLSSQDKKKFGTAVGSVKTFLQKTGDIVTITGNTLGITGALNILAALYVKVTNPQTESTYFNVEQKKTQIYTENNAISYFENAFNSSKNLDELLKKVPQLNDVFSTNSLILKKGGEFFNEDGDRIKSLKVSYIQGTLNEDTGKGTTTADLVYGDRLMQELNQNLSGEYFVLIPADSQTEWMMNMGNHISYEELSNNLVWDKIYTIFRNYLRDEINLIADSRGNLMNVGNKATQLRFFREILPEELSKSIEDVISKRPQEIDQLLENNYEEINKAIRDFITADVDGSIKTLGQASQIVRAGDDGKTHMFSMPNLDTSFTGRREINLDKFSLTASDVRDIVFFANINYIINNIEYHKVIFGDPFQFAIKGKALDETKRIKSFLSPRRVTFDTAEFNNFANDYYNKVGSAQLIEGVPGYHLFKSYTDTITTADVNIVGAPALDEKTPESIRKAYEKTNEADASSWIMDTTYREVKLKNGQWSDEISEPWFQYQMAYTRDRLNKKGVFPDDQYSSTLRDYDQKLLKKGNPGNFAVEVLKPIVSGTKHNAGKIELVLDKFSQFPMFYSFIEGTNLEDLYIRMWKQNIGYAIMQSGRKVGAETLYALYKEDGAVNTEPFPNPVQVSWSSYGIQVENSYEGGKQQRRGSQLTKLATLDMMGAGKPIDINMSDEQWSALSEEQKEITSPLYKKIKENERILNLLTEEGYRTLLSRLGIEDLGTGFRITDKTIAAETLRQELFRRELSDNAKESVSINPETNDFFIPFEASTHYVQIRNILYSIVDKSILSPKVNGGPKVQVTSTMFEKGGREAVYRPSGDSSNPYKKVTSYEDLTDKEKGTVRLTSSELKFYTPDDPYCEVYLPHWFGEKFKKLGMSPEEATEYLNKHPQGKQILTGIGFRIPTQGMNSVEIFRVKGFLPQDMGSSIVVPSEITTKAGSDFDIDKLNTYLKNVYLDHNKKLQLVEYQGSREATVEHYGKVYDRIFEQKKANKAELLEAAQILNYGLSDPKGLVDKYSSLLDALLEDADDSSDLEASIVKDLEQLGDEGLQRYLKDRFTTDMYKRSLENEYFKSLEELLTSPEIYERLINPTSEGELKVIAGNLDNLKGEDESTIKNRLLNRSYMSFTRHAFLTGKRWVGIGAVNITGHSLMQRIPVYIDVERAVPQDRKWLGDGSVLLPHNSVNISSRQYPSLSGIMDQDGVFISDKLSAYITAFVDVSKDPFILKIIYSNAIVSTFLFLERLGVPTQTVALFMNQPAIQTYVKRAGNTGFLSFSDSIFKEIQDKFPSTLEAENINLSKLGSNIKKFYANETFTAEENAQQKLILREFLKYAKMADHVFKMTQATNYDTASFRSGFDIDRKQQRSKKAQQSNIIISAGKILNSSFIGPTAVALSNSREAIGTLLKFEQSPVRQVIDRTLEPYSTNEYLSNDNFQRIGLKVVNSFLDYLIQTQGKLNNRIKDLMVDLNTSVAQEVAQAHEAFPDNELIRDLRAMIGSTQEGVKNVSLFVNIREVYDENRYTGMFRELRDDSRTQQLYYNLIKLALLQGTGISPISFGNIIPVEDYARVLTPIVNNLLSIPDLHNFADNASFQRNNWRDEDIVPSVTPKFFFRTNEYGDEIVEYDEYGNEYYFFYSRQFPTIQTLGIKSTDRQILLLSDTYNQRYLRYPVVKVRRMIRDKSGIDIDITKGTTVTDRQKAIARSKGDYSLWQYFGYKQVFFADGTPLTTTNRNGEIQYVYKQINLHGDSFRLQEYYKDGRPSAVPNGTVKIEKEIPDEAIIQAYTGLSDSDSSNEPPVPPAPVSPTAPTTAVTQEIPPVPPSVHFKPLDSEGYKKGRKKEAFTITQGDGSKQQVEGYRVEFPDHPDFKSFVYGEKKNWSWVEESSGLGIVHNNTSIKAVVEEGIRVINNAIGRQTNTDLLSRIGLSKIPENEITDVLNQKDRGC